MKFEAGAPFFRFANCFVVGGIAHVILLAPANWKLALRLLRRIDFHQRRTGGVVFISPKARQRRSNVELAVCFQPDDFWEEVRHTERSSRYLAELTRFDRVPAGFAQPYAK